MSTLVQYLAFLANSRESNEKKEKLAGLLAGFAPKVTGALKEYKAPEKLTNVLTDKSQTSNNNQNALPRVGVASKASASMSAPAFSQAVSNPARGYNANVPAPEHIAKTTSIPRVMEGIESFSSTKDPKEGTLLDKKSSVKFARNTGIVDVNGELYVNTNDIELLGKLGFALSANEYSSLEKSGETLDVYSYAEKVAGVPKEVARLIDTKKAFSAEYLKDMGYSVPKGYEVKGDLVCPVEKTGQSFQQDEKKEKGSSEKTARCWEGYEPVPGKEAYSENSCRKKEKNKQNNSKKASFNSFPTLTQGGPLAIESNPVNIPTETLAQANPPSVKTIIDEVGVGKSDLLPAASLLMTRKIAPFVPKALKKKITRFNIGANIGAGELNAAQREENKDNTGAWIDRIGGIGGAMSSVPNPYVSIPGSIISGTALVGGLARDVNRVREKYSGPPVLGGNKSAFPAFNQPQTSPLPVQPTKQGNLKSAAADTELKSSNLQAVGHDKKTKILEVLFRNGSEYRYKDVPRSLYSRLLKAKSHGKFFNKHIKRDTPFDYEKIVKQAAAYGELKRLRLAASNGCEKSREILKRMGASGGKAPRKLKKRVEPIAIKKETHQGVFPFEGHHQIEEMKMQNNPKHTPDPTKYLGRTTS